MATIAVRDVKTYQTGNVDASNYKAKIYIPGIGHQRFKFLLVLNVKLWSCAILNLTGHCMNVDTFVANHFESLKLCSFKKLGRIIESIKDTFSELKIYQ